jgi:hypothetical protein
MSKVLCKIESGSLLVILHQGDCINFFAMSADTNIVSFADIHLHFVCFKPYYQLLKFSFNICNKSVQILMLSRARSVINKKKHNKLSCAVNVIYITLENKGTQYTALKDPTVNWCEGRKAVINFSF